MRSPALMFGGIPIYASDLLANTKTIRWKTERKWCHWKNAPGRRYRWCAKEISCHEMVMFGGQAFMSPEGIAKIRVQLGQVEQ
ncbi:TPA: hypothetical protein QEM47_000416 [Pseudomonas putida]|uniref:hypothetical protein n=1 Tax=Pseudomonas putida TaxID=303 RepID=UPI000A813C0D|nr:hypothetical protein [Pseudomonas putida]MDD2116951.1 hypothetical protein [Pseudomonas putida]UPU90692.1 hypothetical protein M0766_17465 [Pseudomonas putida]HDS1727703.1 hypothetical protein [Pseudomonas putida]